MVINSTTPLSQALAGLPVQVLPDCMRVLVVGGHPVGEQLCMQLLKQTPDAEVTLLAPVFSAALQTFAQQQPNLQLVQKNYHESDLAAVQLVIAATTWADLVERLRSDCRARNIVFSLAAPVPETPLVSTTTAPLVPKRTAVVEGSERNWKRIATLLVVAFALMVSGHVLLSFLPLPAVKSVVAELRDLLAGPFGIYVLTGFFAQLVDGALGMGYGLVSASCLMTAGIHPVTISAAIHTSEVFTSGISGYSHYRFGNVNRKLFRHLVIPGVLGAALGALALVFMGQHAGRWLLPALAVYAFFLGTRILWRAVHTQRVHRKVKRIGWLAAAGGFFDSFGGGGWGPLVTSTLLAGGRSPRYTIGSVSLTEFFVTLTSAVTFFMVAGTGHWLVIAGLLVGGAVASPIAVRLAGRLPKRVLLIAVGVLVLVWSTRLILRSFF